MFVCMQIHVHLCIYILYIITMPSRCHLLHMLPLNVDVKAMSKRFLLHVCFFVYHVLLSLFLCLFTLIFLTWSYLLPSPVVSRQFPVALVQRAACGSGSCFFLLAGQQPQSDNCEQQQQQLGILQLYAGQKGEVSSASRGCSTWGYPVLQSCEIKLKWMFEDQTVKAFLVFLL